MRLVNTVIGANAKDTVTYEEVVGGQLKSKFIEKLTVAISSVMRNKKVSFGDMGLYGSDISSEMNTVLNDSFNELYGLEITDVAIADINLTDASMQRVNKIDDASIFSDKNLQSGLMASATADAMKAAAGNDNGAMAGFMGMNMAGNVGANVMGAVNTSNGSNNIQSSNSNTVSSTDNQKPKFCPNCGAATNGGNFCTQCGTKLS